MRLFKKGYCNPQVSQIARVLKEPSSTIHYNIKRLEKDAIKAYKAVFDYKKIDEGFCVFVLISLSSDQYGDPEKIGAELAKLDEIESVDVCTGDWELIIKVRTKDQDTYYEFAKNVIARPGIMKTKTLMSMKQLKTEFVEM